MTPANPERRGCLRFAPALALIFLAPWVGEYLLGNVPASMLAALPVLAPLYGGGALVIREATRRTGRGWPTMLVLGMAYGVIEAGLVDQSLFNPSFQGHEFHTVTPIPGLGFSAFYAATFVMGHAIWSIGIPIALVEMLTPSRRTTPWLGPVGLAGAVALYLFGCWFIFQDLVKTEQFLASPQHRIGASVAALGLIAAAFAFPKRRPATNDGWTPSPWQVGVGAFVLANAFFVRPETWAGVAVGFVLLATAALLVAYLSRRRTWSLRHEYALVAGTLPTYAWAGFVLTAMLRPEDSVAWAGNVVFALLAVALLFVTGRVVWRDADHTPQ